MKILSWNCYLAPWSATRKIRLVFICGIIFDLKPDIVCLQEIFFKKDADFLTEFLFRFYPHSHYYKNLLMLSKYPLEGSVGKTFNKQGNLFSFAILDKLYGKAFQYATVNVKNEKYIITNTHLLSANAYTHKHYQQIRTNQLNEIYNRIENLADKKIIAGDFNFENNAPPYFGIKENDYIDLLEINTNTTINKRLDYIITKNILNSAVTLASDLKDKFSDHRIVILEIGE